MVPEPSDSDFGAPPIDDHQRTDDGFGTVLNGLIGGLAGVILSFVPLVSTIAGGAIAGYLEGGETNDGLTVGAIAGLVMVVPYSAFAFVVFFMLLGVGPAGFGVIAIFALLFVAALTVGLSVLGGVLGVALAENR
ncbi:DUF5518 domain-containing protein [Halosolutus amylolyticus]|uniref:DUF5518 domain-containing protein n=1 Tax=Halosolutus amylolyticus TaxID=2932267 RepID=A0ABD5PS06_9EURY|nr:DUF5518 domain-containing protein [Halosolutus amylolyticus]